MSKKRVKWKQIKDLFLPGWTCQQCHGEGKYTEQVDYVGKVCYPTIYCICHIGQRMRLTDEKIRIFKPN